MSSALKKKAMIECNVVKLPVNSRHRPSTQAPIVEVRDSLTLALRLHHVPQRLNATGGFQGRWSVDDDDAAGTRGRVYWRDGQLRTGWGVGAGDDYTPAGSIRADDKGRG